MEDILRLYHRKTNVDSKYLNHLKFADDVVLVGKTIDELNK